MAEVPPATNTLSPAPGSPATPGLPGGQSPPAANAPLLVIDENPNDFRDGDSAIFPGDRSDTMSLRSSILRYRQENGRTYHSYKDGTYLFPNDDDENERLDLQHHIFLLTYDGRLHIAPLNKEPRHVLDAGCGTGTWAIEFADEHPEAQIQGIDLSPIQPAFVPPNVEFFVDDLEDDWTYSTKFDFIFARMLVGSVKNWPKFFKQSFDNLEPGGVIEVHDLVYPLRCEDGTLAENSALKRWDSMIAQGLELMGGPLGAPYHYEEYMREAGFVDIVQVHEKWPCNHWPKEKKYKQLGIWSNENISQALGGASLAIFTRPVEEGGYGWSTIELEVFLAQVRAEMGNPDIHSYFAIGAWYAKKPE